MYKCQQMHEKRLGTVSHRDMQIKTTMTFYFIGMRMALMFLKHKNKCWQACKEINCPTLLVAI